MMRFSKELKDSDTSKGTIRFQADRPVPVVVMRKPVKASSTEHARRRR
jgi:uncharacterized protein YdhG (YjbR/CyaY superfamily)